MPVILLNETKINICVRGYRRAGWHFHILLIQGDRIQLSNLITARGDHLKEYFKLNSFSVSFVFQYKDCFVICVVKKNYIACCLFLPSWLLFLYFRPNKNNKKKNNWRRMEINMAKITSEFILSVLKICELLLERKKSFCTLFI